MNRSAEDGEWSSPHYGGEGDWVPLRRTKVCADDTVGKSVSDPGRPGIVQREGMAGIVRHSQTKGRATGNAKPSLEPPGGRGGYKRKRSSDRSGARSRIGARYSGTGSEQKAPDRRLQSGDAGRTQKTGRRGKAPCCVAVPSDEERVSRWRKCGQVRNAKDPAPTSRRPGRRRETLEVREYPRRRKVHSLIDKVYDPVNLAEAWKHVRENKGSAASTVSPSPMFEERQAELPGHAARKPARPDLSTRPVKRVAIAKPGGGTRNLGIPSVTDRVVQQALVQKMNPIFEPLFADCSFGYRPGRSPQMAMRKMWREINEGNLWILDADLRSFFDSIDQDRLVSLIADEISDGRILQLIRSFLEAGLIDEGGWQPTKTGVPQGGVASPLWSNIFLTPFDHAMTEAGYRLTRWADDFVVVCRTRQEAEAALAMAETILRDKLGVSLHPEKTRIVHVELTGSNSSATRSSGAGDCGYPRRKRTTKANPLGLYAVPREKSVTQVHGSNPQPDAPARTGDAAGNDRGHQPDHPRLGELLPEGECPKAVPQTRWLDRATTVVLHRQTMAEYGVASIPNPAPCNGLRTGSADRTHTWDQPRPPFPEATTQESGLRENCTSRLSERAEAGRKPHLSRLYTDEVAEQRRTRGSGGDGGKGRGQGQCGPGQHVPDAELGKRIPRAGPHT